MSENKHYGRQIFLSLFLTVFILLAGLYLASRYLLPLYDVNQQQIYDILVKLFPILLGLVMIEVGVMIARRRDEEYADQVDKLPPNAYDKPFYTLPGDDPSHLHSDELLLSQQRVHTNTSQIQDTIEEEELKPQAVASVEPMVPKEEEAMVKRFEMAEQEQEPVVPEAKIAEPVAENITYNTDFDTILEMELDNSKEMDYDLTLVMIEVTEGPASLIANKLMMLSGELAYSFTLEGGKIAMVLPFYNGDEARSFTLSIIESCQKEFSGSSLQLGFASRNGRIVDKEQLLHEAQSACSANWVDN
ncbi:hypothetical protein [uncultured Sphaerochaeta sp.]|uniref:hypothetical protein n=1 Tax=uncultured Sphaerochaeta sp. TaxID=886478 RepID=UPI0029CAA86D|nr:hypothetical protein [uncultured Sphaerochaeta sp.]